MLHILVMRIIQIINVCIQNLKLMANLAYSAIVPFKNLIFIVDRSYFIFWKKNLLDIICASWYRICHLEVFCEKSLLETSLKLTGKYF